MIANKLRKLLFFGTCIVQLQSSLALAETAAIQNPTNLRVFASRTMPNTLVVIPESVGFPISQQTTYLVSPQECANYTTLDQKELEYSRQLLELSKQQQHLLETDSSISEATMAEFQKLSSEFKKIMELRKDLHATRLLDSHTVGGEITVKYDFGTENKIKEIQAANQSWKVDVAELSANNREIFYSIADLPRTESDFNDLPLILDYSVGSLRSADLTNEQVIPDKTLEIRNGTVTAKVLISKAAACYDMQLTEGQKPFQILFAMSLSESAYYGAFPSDYLEQVFGNLKHPRGTDKY